jgi:uncharacterized protein (DUF885 family)
MDNLGPKYNAYSVAAHEGRPGHHTQVIWTLYKKNKLFKSLKYVYFVQAQLSIYTI